MAGAIAIFALVLEKVVMFFVKPIEVLAEISIPIINNVLTRLNPIINKFAEVSAKVLEKTLVPPLLFLSKVLEMALVSPLTLFSTVLEKVLVPPLSFFSKALEFCLIPPLNLLSKFLEKAVVPPLEFFANILSGFINISLDISSKIISSITPPLLKGMKAFGKAVQFILTPLVYPLVKLAELFDLVLNKIF